MSFQLCPVAELLEASNEVILDYTYISEENFLLVILLTSDGVYFVRGFEMDLARVIYLNVGRDIHLKNHFLT